MARNDNYVSSLSESDGSSSDSENDEAFTSVEHSSINHNGIPPTYFGDINIKDSANIHFGNTAIYNGDVTVQQQFVTAPQKLSLTNGEILNFKTISQDTPIVFSISTDAKENATSNNNCSKVNRQFSQQLSVVVTNPEDENVNRRRQRLFIFLGCTSLIFVLVLVIVFSTVSLGGNQTSSSWGGVDWSNFKNGSYLNGTEGIAPLYSRINWLAQPVAGYEPLEQPVPFVVISHSATNACFTHSQCVYLTRSMQTFHIEGKKWLDIAYNFVVGGDGGAYEGRGWDAVGAHTYGYNTKGIGICFIGTFTDELPPPQQIQAAKLLIEEGVKLGKISTKYKLFAHRQVSATESPGTSFFMELQKWPHWVSSPEDEISQ